MKLEKRTKLPKKSRLLNLIPTHHYIYEYLTEEEQHSLGNLPPKHPDRIQLFNTNIPFAIARAISYYKRSYSNIKDIQLDDLIQESLLGLLRASQLYKTGRAKFVTYAWTWTDGLMRKHIRKALNRLTYSIEYEFESSEGYDTDPFDRHIEPAKDTADLVLENIFKQELHHLLQTKKHTFRPRVYEAISRYFGFNGYDPNPYDHCGKEMNITKEGTRLLVHKGCRQILNDPHFSRAIKDQL